MYWRIRSQKTPGAGCMGTRFVGGFESYRFYPVRPEEVPQLHIEISRLTIPVALDYDSPEELPRLLHQCGWSCLTRGGSAQLLPQFGETTFARRVSFASMPENERSRRPVAAEEASG